MVTCHGAIFKWAHADLRVLIETPADGLVCHSASIFAP